MARPVEWGALGLAADPAPGRGDEAEALARRLRRFADDADRLGNVIGDHLPADVFRERFGNFPAQLKKISGSHRMAADALTAYASRLRDAQATADRALADATDAIRALNAAKALAEQARRLHRTASEQCAAAIGAASAAGITPRTLPQMLADGLRMLWEAVCDAAKQNTVLILGDEPPTGEQTLAAMRAYLRTMVR